MHSLKALMIVVQTRLEIAKNKLSIKKTMSIIFIVIKSLSQCKLKMLLLCGMCSIKRLTDRFKASEICILCYQWKLSFTYLVMKIPLYCSYGKWSQAASSSSSLRILFRATCQGWPSLMLMHFTDKHETILLLACICPILRTKELEVAAGNFCLT